MNCKPNAAPEWQAGSFRWRSTELKAACPLEGLAGARTNAVSSKKKLINSDNYYVKPQQELCNL